ncbi:MAG TPA: sporulation integral membrane protein YlbJ [Bacillota bacterium]|nr:sporulation integral membrane protein YlbJ [Bacillota bacterium]
MRWKPYVVTLFFAISSMLLVVAMIRFPQMAFDSSLRGLKIWWDVLFPALMPFMIISEIMMGFGVVHFMGVLLEPLMRPLFNVPGTGGFVTALGLASSYPVGPKLTVRLREQNLVSRAEGERLVCFTSTSDPLFIFGAIAVGFFHDASLGLTIAISNYTGAILLGILLRFHDWKGKKTIYTLDKDLPIFLRAFRAMHRARMKEKRPLGKLMGDAVLSSFQTVFVIGGFIILFSVIMNFITSGFLASFIAAPFSVLLQLFHLPEQLSKPFIIGFFEVTQGMKSISELIGNIDLKTKVALASAFVAWGGISVHAQVASIISSTDMRYKPYFIYKMVHAIFSWLIALAVWDPLRETTQTKIVPVFMQQIPSGSLSYAMGALDNLGAYALILLLFLLVLSFFTFLWKSSTRSL